MSIVGVSHVAISVRDMDKSLPFYRDLLGLQVTLDAMEPVGGALVRNQQQGERRAVYMRWGDGPHAPFVVLSEYPDPTPGEPLRLDQIGIHHFAFWVDNLEEIADRLKEGGVHFLTTPRTGDTVRYGEPPGGKVLTTLFLDPDGTVIQLDQRMS